MIDASKGFLKDGNKNRLRERDIHKIVDAFNKTETIEKFSRMVPLEEIADPKNDYNLNMPRYIDATEKEDIQDIDAHLNGGIPISDLDEMHDYWSVLPNLRNALFENATRPGYLEAKVNAADIKSIIHQNTAFEAVQQENALVYEAWKNSILPLLTDFDKAAHPKALIGALSESLLNAFKSAKLVNAYEIYQHLMNYWNETLQDDAYLIAADGWKAETYRVTEEIKAGEDKGKRKDKGWTCDLIPKPLIVAKYFDKEQNALDNKQVELETALAQIAELEEEHGGDDGVFAELDKINKAEVNKRLKEIKGQKEYADEKKVLDEWLRLDQTQSEIKTEIKKIDEALDALACNKYPTLTENDVKSIVMHDKWLPNIQSAVKTEMERVSQQLTGRIKELIARYETPLPKLKEELRDLEEKVNAHLQKMGFAWN